MNVKDLILRKARERALEEAEFLAGEFARAASEEKEAIMTRLEFEKWLAEACLDALPELAEEPF